MRSGVLVAVLALACATGTARGAETDALTRVELPPSAVALAAPDVLFATDLFGVRVYSVRADGPARGRFSADAEGGITLQDLAASPRRAALSLAERDGREFRSSRLVAGPARGPLAFQAGSASGRPSGERVYGVAVAGDTVVSVESAPGARPGRDDRPARVVVRDLARPGAPVDLVPASNDWLGQHVAAAGPFVAYSIVARAAETVVVVDRASGAEVNRIAFGRRLDGFDVQADGTLAVALPKSRSTDAIAVARPGAGAAREVAVGSRPTAVRIAADQIAFARGARDGLATEVALAPAAGGAPSPASFPLLALRGFDWDGERVAFAGLDCVYTGAAGASATPPRGPCPRAHGRVDAPGRAGLGARRRSLPFIVTCPDATPAGCQGRLVVSYLREPRGRATTLASARVRVPLGATRTVRVRVSAEALRRVRGRTSSRLGVMLLLRDDQGLIARTGDGFVLTTPARGPVPAPPQPAPRRERRDRFLPDCEFCIG
jgi:hypothetical protein